MFLASDNNILQGVKLLFHHAPGRGVAAGNAATQKIYTAFRQLIQQHFGVIFNKAQFDVGPVFMKNAQHLRDQFQVAGFAQADFDLSRAGAHQGVYMVNSLLHAVNLAAGIQQKSFAVFCD